MAGQEIKGDDEPSAGGTNESGDYNHTEKRDTIILETGPLLWPVVFVICAITAVAGVIIGIVYFNPELVGGPTFGEVLINVVLILGAIIIARYIIKLIILNRMTYTVYEDGFKIGYEILFRKYERELPVEQLRGKEYDRGRIESLFGCATIRLLTGGTDRSLGFIEFESVREPQKVLHTISEVQDNYVT